MKSLREGVLVALGTPREVSLYRRPTMTIIKAGDKIKLTYADKEFEVIVIDPDGLGKGQPSVGLGFRMIEKYAGIPQDTMSRWVMEKGISTTLKLPSDKTLRVMEITSNTNNTYFVVEINDCFDLVCDLIENPGKTSKSLKSKLISFIKWFAVKGV